MCQIPFHYSPMYDTLYMCCVKDTRRSLMNKSALRVSKLQVVQTCFLPWATLVQSCAFAFQQRYWDDGSWRWQQHQHLPWASFCVLPWALQPWYGLHVQTIYTRDVSPVFHKLSMLFYSYFFGVVQAFHIVITLGKALLREIGSSIALVELLPEMKASATACNDKQSTIWDPLLYEMQSTIVWHVTAVQAKTRGHGSCGEEGVTKETRFLSNVHFCPASIIRRCTGHTMWRRRSHPQWYYANGSSNSLYILLE